MYAGDYRKNHGNYFILLLSPGSIYEKVDCLINDGEKRRQHFRTFRHFSAL